MAQAFYRHVVTTRSVARQRKVMPSYFALDTETTGLPTTRARPTPKNVSGWDECRLLSIALVKYNEDHEELDTIYKLVYPDTFEVKATEIHGITDEEARTNGVTFDEIYITIKKVVEETPLCVGHNISFDINVIRAECIRRGFNTGVIENINPMCTLKLAKKIYLKPIKLSILYKQLFDKELDGAHNALADARAAGEVYSVLLKDPREFKPIKAKRVIIKASEVAACIGLNNYRSPSNVIDDIWSKTSPETFSGLTKDQRNEQAVSSSPYMRELYESLMNIQTNSSDEVQNIIHVVNQMVDDADDLSLDHKSMVKDHMRKLVYTNHGIRAEDTTADLDGMVLHKDETFYKLKIATIEGTDYVIVGRIDRYEKHDDGSRTIVEIKNRTKSLFNKVRDYEMVQVQTYLHMMGLSKARLVEQYNNTCKSYPIDKNEDLWVGMIKPGLENFCKALHWYMCK